MKIKVIVLSTFLSTLHDLYKEFSGSNNMKFSINVSSSNNIKFSINVSSSNNIKFSINVSSSNLST